MKIQSVQTEFLHLPLITYDNTGEFETHCIKVIELLQNKVEEKFEEFKKTQPTELDVKRLTNPATIKDVDKKFSKFFDECYICKEQLRAVYEHIEYIKNIKFLDDIDMLDSDIEYLQRFFDKNVELENSLYNDFLNKHEDTPAAEYTFLF